MKADHFGLHIALGVSGETATAMVRAAINGFKIIVAPF
jgi:hypothetical protein